MTDKTQIGQIVMYVITCPVLLVGALLAVWCVVQCFRDVFAPLPSVELAKEYAPLCVGDETESKAVFIVQRWPDRDARYAIAENGKITWTGNITEFGRLVRDAARLDRSLSC